MAITTFDARSLAQSATPKAGLIARLRERFISGRQETVDREIIEHLMSLDDQTLEAHGYTRKALHARFRG
jgi:hypothetical protein